MRARIVITTIAGCIGLSVAGCGADITAGTTRAAPNRSVRRSSNLQTTTKPISPSLER